LYIDSINLQGYWWI